MGPQRDPNIQFPRFQVRRFRDTVPQVPVSEFPSFQGPSVGPRKDHTFQIPRFHVCRFQDTPPQLPDSKIPGVQIPGYCSANSRFRVSEFPRPPLGSGLEVHPNSRFRVSESPRTHLGSEPNGPPDSRFRVSEFPRPPLRSQADGLPNSRFRVSEFPRTPLRVAASEGPTNFRVSIPRDFTNVGRDSRLQRAVSISAPVLSCSPSVRPQTQKALSHADDA